MATHSSILAWRIPGMGEPGGLLSVGLHRVGHDWSDLACMHALEKEMATQSSILAWRIPWTEEPDGLLSMGSHRVRHDWSDLAAAAAIGRKWCLIQLGYGWPVISLNVISIFYILHYRFLHQETVGVRFLPENVLDVWGPGRGIRCRGRRLWFVSDILHTSCGTLSRLFYLWVCVCICKMRIIFNIQCCVS